MSNGSDGGLDRDTNPGVCGYCGYRIRTDFEEFTSVGGYDFAHEKCEAEG